MWSTQYKMEIPQRKISIIVAMSNNGSIGSDGTLMWNLPDDMKHFRHVTLGKPVIMGRKTFESIGRALPGRQNIVISRQLTATGVCIVDSAERALAAAGHAAEIMIIGGESIYRMFLHMTDRLYITFVHADLTGDTSFPEYDKKEFREVSRQFHAKDEKHQYDYTFAIFERI